MKGNIEGERERWSAGGTEGGWRERERERECKYLFADIRDRGNRHLRQKCPARKQASNSELYAYSSGSGIYVYSTRKKASGSGIYGGHVGCDATERSTEDVSSLMLTCAAGASLRDNCEDPKLHSWRMCAASFGNVTALEGLHVTEKCRDRSTHAPGMRPGILTITFLRDFLARQHALRRVGRVGKVGRVGR